jgi:hypothetical protein
LIKSNALKRYYFGKFIHLTRLPHSNLGFKGDRL